MPSGCTGQDLLSDHFHLAMDISWRFGTCKMPRSSHLTHPIHIHPTVTAGFALSALLIDVRLVRKHHGQGEKFLSDVNANVFQ